MVSNRVGLRPPLTKGVMMEEFLKQNLDYCALSGNLYWKQPNGNSRKLHKPVGTNSNRLNKAYRVFGATIGGKSINLYCHRVAWLLYYNEWPSQHIDHIDGDGCNNKITNLRLVTVTQNTQNTSKRGFCSSVYKGVSWSNSVNKWHSYITHNKKRKHLGYFITQLDAAIAYDKAAKELFGEYAKLNFTEKEVTL